MKPNVNWIQTVVTKMGMLEKTLGKHAAWHGPRFTPAFPRAVYQGIQHSNLPVLVQYSE